MIGIYKITSPSGKIYIGQSWNVKKRLKDYKTLSVSKKQRLLNRSFVKYGYENHKFQIIKVFEYGCCQKDLDRHEIFYIYKYRSLCFKLLNLTVGGKGGKGTVREKRVAFNVLYDLYINKNHTKIEISKIVNQKERLIKKYLKEYKIYKPHNLKTLKDSELQENSTTKKYEKQIIDFKNKGMSHKQIAINLEISITVVGNTISKHNLGKKQKYNFKKILDLDTNTILNINEVCEKYSIKKTTLMEQFRNNRLKNNLKLI